MPIGVPKVPYRIPGDEEATWVDLYNVMYRERTLFLGQEIRCEVELIHSHKLTQLFSINLGL